MDVLVVDDELATLRLICFVLEQAGYTPRHVPNGMQALAEIERREPDLVLLDVAMPTLDGFEVCQQIRLVSSVPIMFLTARGLVQDRVKGLRLGGDDYIIKPFEAEELIARVNAVLRRSRRSTRESSRFTCGAISLDPLTQVVTINNNQRSDLTPIEFRLMHYLMQNVGQILTTDQILSDVWGYSDNTARNLVAVYIRRLRTKIEPSASRPDHIKTVAKGYRFET
ncbi:MAG: response regulator transcription factor [Roseiflexaceae bacterium]|nr:response regulator transcription factor [Roseiflexaceae bacterium]